MSRFAFVPLPGWYTELSYTPKPGRILPKNPILPNRIPALAPKRAWVTGTLAAPPPIGYRFASVSTARWCDSRQVITPPPPSGFSLKPSSLMAVT